MVILPLAPVSIRLLTGAFSLIKNYLENESRMLILVLGWLEPPIEKV